MQQRCRDADRDASCAINLLISHAPARPGAHPCFQQEPSSSMCSLGLKLREAVITHRQRDSVHRRHGRTCVDVALHIHGPSHPRTPSTSQSTLSAVAVPAAPAQVRSFIQGFNPRRTALQLPVFTRTLPAACPAITLSDTNLQPTSCVGNMLLTAVHMQMHLRLPASHMSNCILPHRELCFPDVRPLDVCGLAAISLGIRIHGSLIKHIQGAFSKSRKTEI